MRTDLRQEIESVLAHGMARWNERDLNGYLEIYHTDSNTTVVAEGKIYRGPAEIQQMYSERYASTASMGKLKITVLELKPLGTNYALITARCELMHEAGSFDYLATIVFCRTLSGWQFYHVTASA
jgi:ketosteroid isomerase-like protein